MAFSELSCEALLKVLQKELPDHLSISSYWENPSDAISINIDAEGQDDCINVEHFFNVEHPEKWSYHVWHFTEG